MTEDQLQTSFLKYRKTILCFCFGCIKDWDNAEDITMNVFMKLSIKRESIRFETVENYLMISARNRVVDFQRKQKRIRLHERVAYDPVEIILPANYAPVYELIKTLPDRMREVIRLTYLEEYSRAEIAAMTGVSPNTVRNTLAAGIEKLRARKKELKNIL